MEKSLDSKPYPDSNPYPPFNLKKKKNKHKLSMQPIKWPLINVYKVLFSTMKKWCCRAGIQGMQEAHNNS